MPRSIDVAYFECQCGHRSTPPDSINSIPHLMEIHSIIPATASIDPQSKAQTFTPAMDQAATATKIATLKQKHAGNNISVIVWGNNDQVVKFDRSYSKVTIKDTASVLEDSKHLLLSCPNCGATLYEAKWR